MYYIYSLASSESPENVRYIGYSINPTTRLAEHIKDVSRKDVKTYKKNWIRKELLKGNSIIISILTEVNCQDLAKIEEVNIIKLFKSVGARLVNGTLGGDGVKCTEEVRRKISESNKGKIISFETIEKIRIANIGKKRSNEIKRKMSEKRKGICTGRNWTKEHRELQSIRLKNHPINHKGRNLSEDTKLKISKSKIGISSKKIIPVVKLSKEGIILEEFTSLTEAKNLTKINNIHRCINGGRRTAGGYIWKYKNNL